MAQFIIRVELHDANLPHDYYTLHLLMEAAGFHRGVTFNDEIKYDLPPAEYYKSDKINVDEMRQHVIIVVAKLGKEFSLLISEVNNIAIYNLKKSND